MLSFKEQVKHDLKTVFHNTEEFADIMAFKYGRKIYKIPAVLDFTGVSERSRKSNDHADGIFPADATLYIQQADLNFIPRNGKNISVDKYDFTIKKVNVEMGEIILYLQSFGEGEMFD